MNLSFVASSQSSRGHLLTKLQIFFIKLQNAMTVDVSEICVPQSMLVNHHPFTQPIATLPQTTPLPRGCPIWRPSPKISAHPGRKKRPAAISTMATELGNSNSKHCWGRATILVPRRKAMTLQMPNMREKREAIDILASFSMRPLGTHRCL